MKKDCKIVYDALYKSPVNVIDTDTNEEHISGVWELVDTRLTSENVETREIGSANLYTAYNLLYKEHMYKSINVQELFLSTLNSLVEQKLIREKPEKVRQGFKVIT